MCFEAKSPKSPRKFDFPVDHRGSNSRFEYTFEEDGGGGGSIGCGSGMNHGKQKGKPPKLNRNFSKASSGSGSGGTTHSAGPSLGYYSEERSPKYFDKSPKSPRKSFHYDSISPKHDKGE